MALTTFHQSDVVARITSAAGYNGFTDHANLLALSAFHVAPYVPSEQDLYFDTGTAKNVLLVQLRPDQEFRWKSGSFTFPLNVVVGDADCELTNWYIYRIDNDGENLGLVASGGWMGNTLATGVHNLSMTFGTGADPMAADELLFIFAGKANTSNRSIVILPDREFAPPLSRIVHGRLRIAGSASCASQPMPRLYLAGTGDVDFEPPTRLLLAGEGGCVFSPDWVSGYEPFEQVAVLFNPIEPPIDLARARLPVDPMPGEIGQPVGAGELAFPFLWAYFADYGFVEPSGVAAASGVVEPVVHPAAPIYFPKGLH